MTQPSDITKHRTLNLYGAPSEPVEPPEERCADCGTPLTVVRPGKSQCDNPDCVFNQVKRPRGIPTDLITLDDAGFFDPQEANTAAQIAALKAAIRTLGKCHNCRGSGQVQSHCSEPHTLGTPCPELPMSPCYACNSTGLTKVARDALK